MNVTPTPAFVKDRVLGSLHALVTPPWADQAAGTAAVAELDQAGAALMAMDESVDPALRAVRDLRRPLSTIAGGTSGTQAFDEAIDGFASLLKLVARL